MGERADGSWAARQVALSTPRQNGKSQLIVARALAGILLFGEQTIIVSAHQQDTAREVFSRILDLIESNSSLDRRVANGGIMRAINRESITFESGQTIRFKARSKGGGRGFSCDCLLLDEAQILGAAAWSAILPTMSARPNPQAWLLGTPPTEDDDGEVFGRLRMLGIEARESRLAYLEWSAEPDDPIDDPQTWAKANPAYGIRIDHEAIATELASMSEDQFRLERLGVWPEHSSSPPVVSMQRWRDMRDIGPSDAVRPDGIGVDMSHAREISVGACWIEDDSAHIEEIWAGTDSARALDWIIAAAGRRTPIVIDSASPAVELVPGLRARGCKVKTSSAVDMVAACGAFEARSKVDALTHADQRRLNEAVRDGRKRPIRDAGGWGWDRRDSTSRIHPVVATTLALLAAMTRKHRPSTRREATTQ